ncbi:MAG: hypothetical protein ACRC6V_08630 [Bacteroidales bacterium]
MKLLSDADIFRYQFGNIQMKHPFLQGEMIPASTEYVLGLVDEVIKSSVESTGADSYICVLSGKGNFRNEVAKQQVYKGNRDPSMARPFHYDTIGDHIIANHPCVVVNGSEADDWLGIEQRKDPQNTCISSRDKDLKGVYGFHHRIACGASQPEVPIHWISEFEAMHFFMYQMLIGDNTDNIPGCGKKLMVKWGKGEMLRRKGVGSKTALKLLESCHTVGEMHKVISDQYQIVFEDEWKDVMLEQARLLYIGQTPDNLFDWSWLDFSLSDANICIDENKPTEEITDDYVRNGETEQRDPDGESVPY